MQYLLDTSICVFFLRGKLQIDQIIKNLGVNNFYISEITVFELYFGAENSNDPVKSYESVNKFIKGLKVIPIYGCLKLYAKEKVRLRSIGRPMNDEFDLIIGVTALQNNLILVTDNEKDFELLNGIKIENWVNRNK